MRRDPWIPLVLALLAGGGVARGDEGPDPWRARPTAALVEDLGDGEAAVRVAAARALFLRAPETPALEAALVTALDDGEPRVRLAALQALLRLPAPPVGALEQAAQDADGDVVAVALRALGARGVGEAAVLREALGHAAPQAVWQAVRALGARGLEPEACVEALGRLATYERRIRERGAALARIRELGPAAAAAAAALVGALDGEDVHRLRAVEDALLAIGPAAVPALLASPSTPRRLRLLEAIQVREEEPIEPLLERAGDDEALARLLAQHAAAREAGVPAALRALDGGDTAAREGAWRTLQAAGTAIEPAAWRLLSRMARGGEDASRVAEVLARAPEVVRPFLAELKARLREGSTQDDAVRAAAARLVRLADEKADLPFWQELLVRDGLAVREEAAWALAPYADDLPDTWRPLLDVLRTGEHVASGAAEALVRVGDPMAPPLAVALSRAQAPAARVAIALVLARMGPAGADAVREDAGNPNGSSRRTGMARMVLLHVAPSRRDLLRPLGWNLRNAGQPLERWFLDPYGRIRRPAAPLLGGLEGMIEDEASPIALRVEAVEALTPFASMHGLAAWILLRASGSPEPAVAEAARAALASQGEAAWEGLLETAPRVFARPAPPRRLTKAEVKRIEPRFVAKNKTTRNNSIFEVAREPDLSDEVVRAIAYGLDDPQLCVRLAAAHSLPPHGRVVEARLLEALADENLEIRVAAAEALRLAGGSTAASLPVLLEALRDVDRIVERTVEGSIARRDVRYAHLERRYREWGSDLRYQLLSRLAWHGEDAWPIVDLVPPLLEVERCRHAAIDVLLGMGPRGRDALARALAGATPEAAAAIAGAYGRLDALREGEAIWLRDAAIRFDRMPASWPCFRAIARHGAWTKAAVVTLVQKLECEPARLEEGIHMLGASDSEHAAPFLAACLDDELHRRVALHALEQLGPKAAPALGALRARIPSADRDELHQLLGVLEGLGPAAAPAAEDLLELLGGDARIEPGFVLQRLVRILPEEERTALLEGLLLDPDPARRRLAAGTARTEGVPPRLLLVLDWLTADPDPTVRDAAVRALLATDAGLVVRGGGLHEPR